MAAPQKRAFDALLVHTQRIIQARQLLPRGSRVVVGVSGGVDSMVLWDILHRLRTSLHLTLIAAHLDHGLRPESAEDARWVRDAIIRQGLPVVVKRRQVSVHCERAGWSLEDGARRIRYHVLNEIAVQASATHIALAHTADDQAETVLMRLLRGTGLQGLRAIPLKRRVDETQLASPWIVRPLLQTERSAIAAYARTAGVPFREDATNQDRRFLRNRIRHELLPLLEQAYNPRMKSALRQLAALSEDDHACLERFAARQWRRVVKRRGRTAQTALGLSISRFRQQPVALQRRLLRRALTQLAAQACPTSAVLGGLEFRHWLEAERLFDDQPSGTVLDLPGGIQLQREGLEVVCTRRVD